MVRSKYEKYEILITRPHVEGTNKLIITHEGVKNKHRSVYPSEKHKRKRMDRT